LDPVTAAGGPTNQTTTPQPLALQPSGRQKLGPNNRELLVTGGVLFSGQTGTASVELMAQGNENALGFSLDYDPTLVSLTGVNAGANAAGATLDINTNQASAGRIGVALALSTGTTFAAGTQELVRLSFRSSLTNTAMDSVSFGDSPVVRQVSDPTATVLAASYVGGAMSINPVPALSISQAGQKVILSWPGWATNYVLQSSSSVGASAVWSNAPVAGTVTNGLGAVTAPVSGQEQFYRLVHQ
jgi:hypothetical protein